METDIINQNKTKSEADYSRQLPTVHITPTDEEIPYSPSNTVDGQHLLSTDPASYKTPYELADHIKYPLIFNWEQDEAERKISSGDGCFSVQAEELNVPNVSSHSGDVGPNYLNEQIDKSVNDKNNETEKPDCQEMHFSQVSVDNMPEDKSNKTENLDCQKAQSEQIFFDNRPKNKSNQTEKLNCEEIQTKLILLDNERKDMNEKSKKTEQLNCQEMQPKQILLENKPKYMNDESDETEKLSCQEIKPSQVLLDNRPKDFVLNNDNNFEILGTIEITFPKTTIDNEDTGVKKVNIATQTEITEVCSKNVLVQDDVHLHGVEDDASYTHTNGITETVVEDGNNTRQCCEEEEFSKNSGLQKQWIEAMSQYNDDNKSDGGRCESGEIRKTRGFFSRFYHLFFTRKNKQKTARTPSWQYKHNTL